MTISDNSEETCLIIIGLLHCSGKWLKLRSVISEESWEDSSSTLQAVLEN